MIVDDQAEVRNLIYYSLANLGYTLLTASDGDAALEAYYNNKPEVIILDIMMPGSKSGLDVCKKIKSDGACSSKIIFLSALTQASDIARAMAAGGDAYVTKPFSPMALIREIHRMATDEG